MKFSKLRLSGFKSFVDPTELVIEEGLTGVVGPNGCGKSNLVEALRWVMGETSAKQMRGGEMNDVIFGGSDKRPSRNLAEVGLSIANDDRRAPAQFNDADELQITRRIERDKGSNYRVNGKDVRARDVQLLFADAATGARSAGLVSQGRIGNVIQAKPGDRRVLLEEAANIRGLHTRRHEAELRLKAAEQNMERLEDVLKALEGQRAALRRQARQAQRYRELSEQIRFAEAVVLHARWKQTIADREAAGRAVVEAGDAVARATEAAAQATTRQAETAAALPALRQAEVEASAELQRLLVARGELDAEEQRITTAKTETESRLRHIADDLSREQALMEEAKTTIERLIEERDMLVEAGEGEEEVVASSAAELANANRAAEAVEEAVHKITESIAVADARRAALDRQLRQAEDRIARLDRQRAELAERRAELAGQAVPSELREQATARVEAAIAAVEAAEQAIPSANEALSAAREAEQQARRALQEVESELSSIRSEADGLRRLLAAETSDGNPIVDAIIVDAGFEAALGAAVGDDLEAPEIPLESASSGWTGASGAAATASLPSGAKSLDGYVKAPLALAARLALIGVVESAEQARSLLSDLAPGMRLITREGELWRWDGFHQAAGKPSAAALRLERRNRLAELEKALAEAESRVDAGKQVVAAQVAEREAAEEAVEAARTKRAEALSERSSAESEASRLEAQVSAVETKLSALDEGASRLGEEKSEAEAQRETAQEGLKDIPDVDALRAQSHAKRAELAERRAELVEARTEHDRLVREGEQRRTRLASVQNDLQSWQDRSGRAGTRLQELTGRRNSEQNDLEQLSARPKEIAEQRVKLADEIDGSEQRRRDAADALASAEVKQAESDREAREAEKLAAEAREHRIRLDGALEQINERLRAERERISERLDCRPDEILTSIEMTEEDELPDPEETRQRLERLTVDRERIGPVNLRAEAELADLDQQIEGMENERDDLTQAIMKLRGAISSLNKEGRERLMDAFKRVDGHFRTLFSRLFGGGHAHLELTEADDPLDAGLEIMASPPGKKLQNLTLLSGGEQALTAIALVFAVFLTNPSPICVLDEVDAPLDDTNVDRFCSLLEDIAKDTGTRFLIITHHRMTMTRMDRLFGVTMAEQGVSQLVSVDLQRAERLREAG